MPQAGKAQVLNAMDELSLAASAPADGSTRHEEALALARAADLLPEQARALEGIGRCLLDDYPAEAVVGAAQALVIYPRIQSPHASSVDHRVLRETAAPISQHHDGEYDTVQGPTDTAEYLVHKLNELRKAVAARQRELS